MYLLGRSEKIRGQLFELKAGRHLVGLLPGRGFGVFDASSNGEEFFEISVESGSIHIEKFMPRLKLLLNGQKVQKSKLQDGDEITADAFTLKVILDEKDLISSRDQAIELTDTDTSPLAERTHSNVTHPDDFTRGDHAALQLLLELGQKLNRVGTLEEASQVLLQCLQSHFTARRILVLLWDDTQEKFSVPASHPATTPAAPKTVKLSRTLLKLVLSQKKAVFSQDISADSRFQDSESLMGEAIESILCAPLVSGENLIGALYMDASHPAPAFKESNLELLLALASLAAPVFANLQFQQTLNRENTWLRSSLSTGNTFIGKGKAIQPVLKMVQQVAPTDVTVLLRGETGTGKELIARMLHDLSSRRHAPFESVNCAALSEHVLESELFGHEKGAFTGATDQKKGKFELPDGGTLFLDEIGEIPPDIQVKLLRFLQERSFERVGGTESIHVNVRIIAATNKNLETAIQKGEFREDLYYRLKVIQVDLPPLRQRADDIELLATHFTQRFAGELGKPALTISRPALQVLQACSWPGNVRQLKNILERTVVLCQGNQILPEDLPWDIQGDAQKNEFLEGGNALKYKTAQEQFEKEFLHRLMQNTRGNVTRASQVAEIERTHLHSKLKKYGIKPGKYRD